MACSPMQAITHSTRKARKMSNYLEDWSAILQKMAADEAQKKELFEKPVRETLEIIRADTTMFNIMLEAMIRYVSEGETDSDLVNMKWSLIAIQLRAVKTAVEHVI